MCACCDVHSDGIDGNAGPKGRSLARRRYDSKVVNVSAALGAHDDVARTFNGLIGFIRFIVCFQSREVCRNRAFHDILRRSSRESHRAACTNGEREGGDVILGFGRNANIRLLFRGEKRESLHVRVGCSAARGEGKSCARGGARLHCSRDGARERPELGIVARLSVKAPKPVERYRVDLDLRIPDGAVHRDARTQCSVRGDGRRSDGRPNFGMILGEEPKGARLCRTVIRRGVLNTRNRRIFERRKSIVLNFSHHDSGPKAASASRNLCAHVARNVHGLGIRLRGEHCSNRIVLHRTGNEV